MVGRAQVFGNSYFTNGDGELCVQVARALYGM